MAREAPVGVIIRRGPSKWFHIVKWDTSTDTFEEGAWLHGRIYEDRCDVSFDGRLFVYLAAQHKQSQREAGYGGIWTAVSRPPWLTALALWPSENGTWGGGGKFLERKQLVLFWGSGEPHSDHQPYDLKISRQSLEEWRSRSIANMQPPPVNEADWSGYDQRGRVIFTLGGKLYALIGIGHKDCKEVELADFTDRRPHSVPPPKWAHHWC